MKKILLCAALLTGIANITHAQEIEPALDKTLIAHELIKTLQEKGLQQSWSNLVSNVENALGGEILLMTRREVAVIAATQKVEIPEHGLITPLAFAEKNNAQNAANMIKISLLLAKPVREVEALLQQKDSLLGNFDINSQVADIFGDKGTLLDFALNDPEIAPEVIELFLKHGAQSAKPPKDLQKNAQENLQQFQAMQQQALKGLKDLEQNIAQQSVKEDPEKLEFVKEFLKPLMLEDIENLDKMIAQQEAILQIIKKHQK